MLASGGSGVPAAASVSLPTVTHVPHIEGSMVQQETAMPQTRIDIGENVRNKMCDLLNPGVVEAIDLAAQIKQAHWTVKGPDFIALHELFDKLRDNVDDYVDTMAERISQLGGVVHATVQVVADKTTLKSYPLSITTGLYHVDYLAKSFAGVSKRTRASIDQADEAGDQATADIFTEVTRGLDKDLWFLEAHLQAKS
jgi:starvation-inducible DNA-binding protein